MPRSGGLSHAWLLCRAAFPLAPQCMHCTEQFSRLLYPPDQLLPSGACDACMTPSFPKVGALPPLLWVTLCLLFLLSAFHNEYWFRTSPSTPWRQGPQMRQALLTFQHWVNVWSWWEVMNYWVGEPVYRVFIALGEAVRAVSACDFVLYARHWVIWCSSFSSLFRKWDHKRVCVWSQWFCGN